MKIIVNGEAKELPNGLTVSSLLEALGVPSLKVAVERNKEIVSKSDYSDVVLMDGDQIEIVNFVGGG